MQPEIKNDLLYLLGILEFIGNIVYNESAFWRCLDKLNALEKVSYQE